MVTRRNTLALLGATPLAVSLAAQAGATTPNSYSNEGFAINGIDPIGYFEQEAVIEGKPEFAFDWEDATWIFSSAKNLEMFTADPVKYAPQFGGYCAYAVSRGYTASTDPKAWSIVNEKLYLNFSRPVRLLWRRDIAGNIALGEANWPGVLGHS